MNTTTTAAAAQDKCPNCTRPIHEHGNSECVLAALISVLRDRGEHTPEQLHKLTVDCDVDQLWSEIGPIIDRLGKGQFNA